MDARDWAGPLIFETHATSLDNEAGRASGWFDVDLSPTGVSQAVELGRRYEALRPAVVWCSDLRRARHTAEIAFPRGDVPIVADPRLRECDYGTMTRAAVAEIDRMRDAAVLTPFPGGESYQQVADRVAAWLAELPPPHSDAPVLVIGHRATWFAFEHLLNAIPLRDAVATPWKWQPGWRYPRS